MLYIYIIHHIKPFLTYYTYHTLPKIEMTSFQITKNMKCNLGDSIYIFKKNYINKTWAFFL